MERMRQERSRLNTSSASGFTNSMPATPGIRTIPSVSTSPQTRPTRSYESWNRDGSTARSEQRQRIYRMDAGSGSSEPSVQRQSPSTWARPTAPVQHPSFDSTPGAVPSSEDRSSARQRVYEVYRGRTDSGRTDRYSPQSIQRESPATRYNPYTPPSPPPVTSHPTGPTPSYSAPAVLLVGPPPSYQGPLPRESVDPNVPDLSKGQVAEDQREEDGKWKRVAPLGCQLNMFVQKPIPAHEGKSESTRHTTHHKERLTSASR
jgi:hypothetical protein